MVDFGGSFFLNKVPPKLPRDTPRLHQPRSHANALATAVVQNRMAQRHHLSKALVVSLMKNQYSNKGFCRGKGRPFDLAVF